MITLAMTCPHWADRGLSQAPAFMSSGATLADGTPCELGTWEVSQPGTELDRHPEHPRDFHAQVLACGH